MPLPVLIDGPHGRRFNLEIAQHARAEAMNPAISAEPQLSIARLGNGENVHHAREKMESMPIEPVEQISAQPDAAFPVLKHRTEAGVREAFVFSVGCQRGSAKTSQP